MLDRLRRCNSADNLRLRVVEPTGAQRMVERWQRIHGPGNPKLLACSALFDAGDLRPPGRARSKSLADPTAAAVELGEEFQLSVAADVVWCS